MSITIIPSFKMHADSSKQY